MPTAARDTTQDRAAAITTSVTRTMPTDYGATVNVVARRVDIMQVASVDGAEEKRRPVQFVGVNDGIRITKLLAEIDLLRRGERHPEHLYRLAERIREERSA